MAVPSDFETWSSHIANRIILICGTLRLRIVAASASVIIGIDNSRFEHEEESNRDKGPRLQYENALVEGLDLRRFETLAL